jgi:hypothetical protein
MADLGRIKLYPKLEIATGPGGHGIDSTTGSLDSKRTDDSASVSPVDSMGKTRSAPSNPPATWSSGPDNNDYLAKD